MNRIKRPPVVWIAQILLVIFGSLLLLTILIDITFLLTHMSDASALVPAVVAFGIVLVILLLFACSFWGLVKGKTYGRWLGVSSLALVWAFIVFAQLSRPSGPFKYYEYDNPAQVAGAIFAQIVLHALFLILIFRLAFARKVGEFFHQGATQEIVGPEPPPASFSSK